MTYKKPRKGITKITYVTKALPRASGAIHLVASDHISEGDMRRQFSLNQINQLCLIMES